MGGPGNDDLESIIGTSNGGPILVGFKNAVCWPLTAIPGPSDLYAIKIMLSDTS